MLKAMRQSAASWTVKIILGLIIVSFISFFGWRSGQGERMSQTVAATVGNEEILTSDVTGQLRNMINMYRNMGLLKDNLSEEMLMMLQSNVLNSLIDLKIKERAAQEMGLLPSEQVVRDRLEKQFGDGKGGFDFERYKKIVQTYFGKSPSDFEDDQLGAQTAEMFDQLLEKTAYVTDEELRNVYTLRNDKVNLWYAEIDPQMASHRFEPIASPTEKELLAYYDAHSSTYQIPEKRELEILSLNLDEFAKPTDTDPKEKNSEKYLGEARKILETAKAQAASKGSFDLQLIDPRIKKQKTEPLAAEDPIPGTPDGAQLTRTAGSLKLGAISDVIRGFASKTVYLLRVASLTAAKTPLMDQVRNRVKTDVLREKREAAAQTYAKKILAKWKDSNAPMNQLVKEEKLPLKETGDFTRSPGHRIPQIGASEMAQTQAFLLTKEHAVIAEPVINNGKVYLLGLKDRTQPNWDLFEKSKPELYASLADELGRQRSTAWLNALRTETKIKRNVAAPMTADGIESGNSEDQP